MKSNQMCIGKKPVPCILWGMERERNILRFWKLSVSARDPFQPSDTGGPMVVWCLQWEGVFTMNFEKLVLYGYISCIYLDIYI